MSAWVFVATATVLWACASTAFWGWPPVSSRSVARRVWGALALGLALLASAGYGFLGRPDLWGRVPSPPALPLAQAEALPATHAAEVGPEVRPMVEAMVARLAARLQQQPQDPAGWRRLARAYEVLGHFALAAQAQQRGWEWEPPDADALTQYAVVLGMAQGRTLVGDPEQAINEALKIDPIHPQALALSGSAAFERGEHRQAVAQWERVLSLLPDDPDLRATMQRSIARAQASARLGPTGGP